MNRLEIATENAELYGIPLQGKVTKLNCYKWKKENTVHFIGRVEKRVTELLIESVLESPIARARLGSFQSSAK